MKLYYANDNNFGDALNPMLFNLLLPNYFDDNLDELFYGVGSIIGLKHNFSEKTKKIIMFSSGFAYGKIPDWGNINIEYVAVRGPLTAKELGIPSSKSIIDGGVLANMLLTEEEQKRPKKYKFGFMPHDLSVKQYDKLEHLCNKLGIKFINSAISPNNTVIDIIKNIQQTEILITEALHGAIVAESFRVPYIPVKIFNQINEFKWKDFGLSVDMDITLHKVPKMYSETFWHNRICRIIWKRIKVLNGVEVPKALSKLIYKAFQLFGFYSEKKFLAKMTDLINKKPIKLSDDKIFFEKRNLLLKKVDLLRERQTEATKQNLYQN